MPLFSFDIYDTLQGTKIACLCPWVKVINYCFAIDSHIKDTNTFVVVFFTTAFTMPRLDKIEFYTIVTISDREVVP